MRKKTFVTIQLGLVVENKVSKGNLYRKYIIPYANKTIAYPLRNDPTPLRNYPAPLRNAPAPLRIRVQLLVRG